MKKLNLTPEEIYNTEFDIDFKGYSAEQVDGCLDKILDDYAIMEENMQELLDMNAQLQDEIRELKDEKILLEGQQKAFDLSNTTNYSSVDILKRISRLEEEVYKK